MLASEIFAIHRQFAPINGECMAFAYAISELFPECDPVGGYVDGSGHWWLEIDGKIVDPISTDWEFLPSGDASYHGVRRGREAIFNAISAHHDRDAYFDRAADFIAAYVSGDDDV